MPRQNKGPRRAFLPTMYIEHRDIYLADAARLGMPATDLIVLRLAKHFNLPLLPSLLEFDVIPEPYVQHSLQQLSGAMERLTVRIPSNWPSLLEQRGYRPVAYAHWIADALVAIYKLPVPAEPDVDQTELDLREGAHAAA